MWSGGPPPASYGPSWAPWNRHRTRRAHERSIRPRGVRAPRWRAEGPDRPDEDHRGRRAVVEAMARLVRGRPVPPGPRVSDHPGEPDGDRGSRGEGLPLAG